MSSTAQKTQGAGEEFKAPASKFSLMRAELMGKPMTSQLQMALPPHVKVEQFQRVLITAIQQTPKLLNCDRRSLFGEAMKAAQLGLLTDGFLGEAYLIAGWDGIAQMRVGYKGLMKLARQSGEISNIYAEAVFKEDSFDYELGLNRTLRHKAFEGGPRGELTHVYAVAKWRDGSDPDFIVMTRAEIEDLRDNRSDGYKAFKAGKIKSTPWATDFVAMAKKTVIRALCKLLPQSLNLQRAMKLEDAVDRGAQVHIQDGEFIVEDPPAIEDQTGKGARSLDKFEGAGATDADTGEVIDAEEISRAQQLGKIDAGAKNKADPSRHNITHPEAIEAYRTAHKGATKPEQDL